MTYALATNYPTYVGRDPSQPIKGTSERGRMYVLDILKE